MNRDRLVLAATALALVATGCSSAPVTPTCEPGRSVECVGVAGCAGGQVCAADGSGWGACVCGEADGGPDASRVDGGGDAGTTDAPGVVDAEVMDAADLDALDAAVLDGAPSDAASDDDASPDAMPSVDGAADADLSDAGTDGGTYAGDCTGTCAPGSRCCSSTCVSTSVMVNTDGTGDPSFTNCGGCGIACSSDTALSCSIYGPSSTPRCMCGLLDACGPGTACTFSEAAGAMICADLATDPLNCGTRGRACGASETCEGGTCRCGAGSGCARPTEECCGGTCLNVRDDQNNCGGCGLACGSFGDRCIDWECRCGVDTCERPGGGAGLGESCCGMTCVPNDNVRCGDCTTACSAPDVCVYSSGSPGSPRRVCCGATVFGLSVCR